MKQLGFIILFILVSCNASQEQRTEAAKHLPKNAYSDIRKSQVYAVDASMLIEHGFRSIGHNHFYDDLPKSITISYNTDGSHVVDYLYDGEHTMIEVDTNDGGYWYETHHMLPDGVPVSIYIANRTATDVTQIVYIGAFNYSMGMVLTTARGVELGPQNSLGSSETAPRPITPVVTNDIVKIIQARITNIESTYAGLDKPDVVRRLVKRDGSESLEYYQGGHVTTQNIPNDGMYHTINTHQGVSLSIKAGEQHLKVNTSGNNYTTLAMYDTIDIN